MDPSVGLCTPADNAGPTTMQPCLYFCCANAASISSTIFLSLSASLLFLNFHFVSSLFLLLQRLSLFRDESLCFSEPLFGCDFYPDSYSRFTLKLLIA